MPERPQERRRAEPIQRADGALRADRQAPPRVAHGVQLGHEAGGPGFGREAPWRERDVIRRSVHLDAEPDAVGGRQRGADRMKDVGLDRHERAAGAQQAARLGDAGRKRPRVGDVMQDKPVQHDVEGRVGQAVELAGSAGDALVGLALLDGEARALRIDVGRHEAPLRRGQQMAAGVPAAADRDGIAAIKAEVTIEQLALAPLAALVLLGERGRVAEPVEQVVFGIGLGQVA